MKVKELIEELKKYDEELDVWVTSGDGLENIAFTVEEDDGTFNNERGVHII